MNYTTIKKGRVGHGVHIKEVPTLPSVITNSSSLWIIKPNKPCTIGCITCWFILLLKFNFIAIVRKIFHHVLANYMSRIHNGEPAI